MLKITNGEVIRLIETQPHIFIRCHKYCVDDNTLFFRNNDQIIRENKKLIDDHFGPNGDFKKYKELLDLVFPSFSSYSLNEVTGDARKKAEAGKRIYSGKYFGTYMREKETSHELLNEDLMQALTIDVENDFYRALDDVFDKYALDDQPEIIRNVGDLLNDKRIKKENLLWYMLSRYYWFDDRMFFSFTTPKRLCGHVIAQLLYDSTNNMFSKFLNHYKKDGYNNLVLLNRILVSFKSIYDDNGKEDEEKKKRMDSIKQLIDYACDIIFSDEMPIYIKGRYDFTLTGILYLYDKAKTIRYINSINNYDSSEFFPLINDYVSESYSSGKVMYSIDLEELKEVLNLPDLVYLVDHQENLSANQQIIKTLLHTAIDYADSDDENDRMLQFDAGSQPSFHHDFFDRAKDERPYDWHKE